ncbi:MAG: GNAT family N-acetyltransferase [Gemmatimonadota bacterium]|nr:GNAT family N-acetyltransferase [Gemmatimonadota bacterium]
MRTLTPTLLSLDDVPDVVSVLGEAFYDYPVMRYVLGPAQPYDERLRRLVELFVSRRAYLNEPMLGVRDAAGTLVAAATVTLPGPENPPATFLALRESIWAELGADAQARYATFAAASEGLAIDAPHHYLDMIGVRRSHQGRGLARVLLEAVHDLSRADERSSGVRLSTERASNVTLYEHFGYRVRGHARVDHDLETWVLFREAHPRS